MKALVTGASKGIGRALVRELVACGHEVWGVARSAVALEALAEELGDQFHYSLADLADQKEVEGLVRELDEAGFYPKKLFLVAGAYSTTDPTFKTPEHQKLMLDTNYQGPIWVYEAMMNRQHPPTCVVAISSIFALLGDNLNPAYADAKTKLAEYFINQNSAQGINSKVVYLGPVNTSINRYAKRNKNVMTIEPDEVARFLRHLPKKAGVEHIFPFSSVLMYHFFRALPKNIYIALMNKVRR